MERAMLMLLVCLSVCAPDREPRENSNRENTMAQSPYFTRFADFRQSSFCPVVATAQGHVAWARPLKLKSRPMFLMPWGDNVLVETASGIALYSDKGNLIWQREKANGLPVSINESYAYYITVKYQLNTITMEGKEKTLNDYIPEVPDNQFPVSLLVPQPRGFTAVVQALGGVHEPPPQVFVLGTEYGSGLSTWELEYDGIQKMTPLFIKEKDLLAVFKQEAIMIGANSGAEVKRIPIPMDNPLVASADPGGDIYVLGTNEDEPELSVLEPGGKVQSRLRLPGLSLHRLQTGRFPPIVGMSFVYVVASHIIAVREGKIVWTFDRAGVDFTYATALGNGFLIASGGGTVVLIDSAGQPVFEVALGKPVSAPPIATPEGKIVVATEDSLIKIE